MKDGIKDQAAGKAHELKGKVKEQVGKLTNDRDLQADGTVEKIGGKVRHAVGKIEKKLGS